MCVCVCIYTCARRRACECEHSVHVLTCALMHAEARGGYQVPSSCTPCLIFLKQGLSLNLNSESCSPPPPPPPRQVPYRMDRILQGSRSPHECRVCLPQGSSDSAATSLGSPCSFPSSLLALGLSKKPERWEGAE